MGANLKSMRLDLLVFLSLIAGCATAPLDRVSNLGSDVKIDKLLVTPSKDGHRDFVEGISSAQISVRLKIYHLTDADVADALMFARKRNLNVQVNSHCI